MRYHIVLYIILLSIFIQPLSFTQPIDSSATISIQSKPLGIKVFIDTVLLGKTPIEYQKIAKGSHILRLVHPDSKNWLYQGITETLDIKSPQHIERVIEFPHLYHISSTPFGAAVRYDDSLIGTTPLLLSAIPDRNVIKMSRDDYEDVIETLSPENFRVDILMTPVMKFPDDKPSLFLRNELENNRTAMYLSAGTLIASGITAAHFKIKADKYYQDYRRTGDNRSLTRVKKLDVASGIFLAISEISLFTLCYLFFSQ